jgi:NitT/TauT family transport system substrate-binding protein
MIRLARGEIGFRTRSHLVRCVAIGAINDPATQDDAVKILVARVGLEPEVYKPLLKGTHLIDLAEGKKIFEKGEGLGSLYGSTTIANDFNVKNAVYKDSQDVDSYIDPSLTDAVPAMAAAP